jgi:hypothetical protein
MEPFHQHVFVCTQGKPEGVASCPNSGSPRVLQALERELNSRGLDQAVQVTTCGCLGLCENGPVMIVYPDGIWYRRVKEEQGKTRRLLAFDFFHPERKLEKADRIVTGPELTIALTIRQFARRIPDINSGAKWHCWTVPNFVPSAFLDRLVFIYTSEEGNPVNTDTYN